MTSCKFYRVDADPAATSRWYLKAPLDPSGNEVDPRLFTQGTAVASMPPLSLPLRHPGQEVGFNFCDFDMVVTPAGVNAELRRLVGPAIQQIPVSVNGRQDQFEILNVCSLVPCVDGARSLFTKWTDADGRPDKTGKFRMIVELKIHPAAAERHHILRVAEWPIALIVSESVKRLFENRNLSGITYDRVD